MKESHETQHESSRSAVEVASQERVYQGKIINLRIDSVRLPSGQTVLREVVEHPGAVVIAALDRDEHLYFVRQYRHPAQKVLLELPAGGLEPGEDPLSTAKRELQEEVGLTAEVWIHLGSFYSSPGFTTEILHAFLAQGLAPVEVRPDDDEDIEIVRYPLADAFANTLRFEDAKTLATLFLLARRLGTDFPMPH
ncbi:MAG: NUDIX hydrolase [Thermoleophilia bacterium]|nr:NUDIX hydrolase [Thermoleophilia bacterium]